MSNFGALARVAMALVFLGLTFFIIGYNVNKMVTIRELGTNYLRGLGRTVQEVEGTPRPTKQGMINLYFGDGMRFVAFLAEHLPKNATVVFPVDKLTPGGAMQPRAYFTAAGWNHFLPILHPRKMKSDVYDYQVLPYTPLRLDEVLKEYRLATWQVSHSNQVFVLQVFVSPDAKEYRLYFISRPLKGDPTNRTENLLIAYPQVVSP